VRYFYAWMPLVIVAAIVFLAAPWLALIALMIFAIVALAALACAVVVVPYMLSRAISRRWHVRSGRSPRSRPAALSVGRELLAPQRTSPKGPM
jgi:hypothetical protein